MGVLLAGSCRWSAGTEGSAYTSELKIFMDHSNSLQSQTPSKPQGSALLFFNKLFFVSSSWIFSYMIYFPDGREGNLWTNSWTEKSLCWYEVITNNKHEFEWSRSRCCITNTLLSSSAESSMLTSTCGFTMNCGIRFLTRSRVTFETGINSQHYSELNKWWSFFVDCHEISELQNWIRARASVSINKQI